MPKKLTKEEVQQKITNNFEQKVILNGEYQNKRTKIDLKCLECGHEWTALPTSVLYDDYIHHCPNCGGKKGRIVKCAFCGKEIYRNPSQLKKSISKLYYCSKECSNRHKNQIREEAGEWDNSVNYRRRAFESFSHKCFVCGWDEDERILEVHHKDENRKNNEIDNLVILCPTCHRKITLGYYELIENKIFPINNG